jgi:hypothetical protein
MFVGRSRACEPANKGMKLTKPSILQLRSLSPGCWADVAGASGGLEVLTDLPARFAMCPAPIPDSRRRVGHLLPSEESASFLLWAWPRLLGWSRAVNWLFSQLSGTRLILATCGCRCQADLLMVERSCRVTNGRDLSDFKATLNS